MNRRCVICLVASTACITGSPTLATNYRWIGTTTTSGGFSNADNWSPAGGPPNDTNDTATFDVLGNYTARFSGDVTNNNVDVDVGIVLLDLFHERQDQFDGDFPYEYTLETAFGPSADITSGPGALFAVKLIVQGDSDPAGGNDEGAEVHADSFLYIGNGVNTNGTLELDNADWISSEFTIVGVTGTGTLKLYNDGELTNTNGTVGLFSGSDGNVNVSDSGSRWRNNGTLVVGGSGDGSMIVEDGGVVSTGGDSFIASASGSVGTVTLNNGRWFNDSSLYVGGTSTATGGNATLTLDDDTPSFQSTEVQVSGNMTIRPTGTVNVNGGVLSVDNLLTIDAGGDLNIGGEIAELSAANLTGAPNSLNWTLGTVNITAGDFFVDTTAPIGNFLFVNTDMALNVAGKLHVGDTAGAGLFIVNTGEVTADRLEIGNTPAPTSATSVSLGGAGSTLNVTNDITVGNDSAAGGQIFISDGSVVMNNNTFAAPQPSQHASLTVTRVVAATPDAEWHVAGSFYLGGTDTTPGGTADLVINEGGLVTIANTLRVWDHATLTLDNGSLTVPLLHHSGLFDHTAPLDLTGAGPITTVVLDGGIVNAPEIDLGTNDFTGHGELNGDVTAHGAVTANGTLTLGDLASFTALNLTGPLNVGTHTVNLHKAGFLNFGPLTTISGGTLNVPNGVAIPVGNSVAAHGAITGRLVQQSGSTILAATGDLTLGDAGSLAGFFSDGELTVLNSQTVTLLDANVAVLGSLTTLGDPGTPDSKGNLTAANGLLVEFGKNVVGHGTVDTPNNPATPLINNGHVQGHAPDELLVLNGYVKGVGSFADVLIAGTLAPGFSPGIVTADNIAFGPASSYDVEVVGTAAPVPGTHHDLLAVSNSVTLNGTLNIFPSPSADTVIAATPLGTEFTVMTWDTRAGYFHTVEGALLSTGFALAPLVSDTDDALTLRASIPGDLNFDTKVSVADLSTFALNFGTIPGLYNEISDTNSWELGDFNVDGAITVADLSLLALNFGFELLSDGTSIGPTPISLSAAAELAGITLTGNVPEPSTFLFLACGGVLGAGLRSRQRFITITVRHTR